MIELLDYDFMRRALIAAVFTGLAAPAIGIYLVHRRLSLLGDGLGHVALTGVALGLLTGVAPLLTAVAVAAGGALLIELLRARGRTSGDVALAMLFYGGISGGLLLANFADESAANLNSYLFGSITTVSSTDVVVVAALGVGILVTCVAFAPQLFAVCQDEEHARVSGLPVWWFSVLISILAAVTITVAMRTVGLLLVSALMVVPVAAAQQVTRSFRATHLAAMSIGLFAAFGGVVASYEVETTPGPTIVMLSIAVFAVLAIVGAIRRRARPRTPEPLTQPLA